MIEQFDLVVIGGGTGGLRLALRAAAEGLETAIVDPGVLGGTCLNTGCIPTKTLLHSAELYQDILRAGNFGIEVRAVKPNFKKIMARMHALVHEGQEHIVRSVKSRKLTVVRGKASFIDQRLIYAGTRTLSAKHFVISTGARPVIPDIKGIKSVPAMVSDDVLQLQGLPKSLAIIGGGYISIELATFFAALGTKVTIIEHGPRILRELDADITSLLESVYQKRGVHFLVQHGIVEVSLKGKEICVVCSLPDKKTETIHASHLLVATGRAPNTAGLALEKAGVQMNEHGAIIVDDMLATSNSAVYALGDVTGRAPFAHAAKREAYIILENILHGKYFQV